MTKVAELRTKSKDELSQMLLNLRKEQFNLRFQATTSQLTNTARSRVIRRDIAKIMTLAAQPEGKTAEAGKNAKNKAPARTAKTKAA